MATGRDPLAGKLPVTLITGFLGSGKTTLISKLVRHPDMNRVAVVINEIGEIGIDHDLVTMSSENISLLANGCICCTVRTDLQETLRELFNQRRAGLMADFDRVIVETTGMADPAPVVQTMVSDTLLEAQFRLDGVVTLVDAVNGAYSLEHQPEAGKQVALADRVLITKGDLFDQESKIARSGLEGFFKRIEIVSEKDQATYRRILRAAGVDAADFAMVGNTVRSDVLPVLALGARAFHVPYHTTWAHEAAEAPEGHAGFRVLGGIGELVDALAG